MKTPVKSQSSSKPRIEMTNFTNGLGQRIPAEAFENDPGAPGRPRLDAAGMKAFNEASSEQAERIKKMQAAKKGET